MLQGECLGELGLRGCQGALEGVRRRGAVLGDCEAEFLFAGLDRVIRLHQRARRSSLQLYGRRCLQTRRRRPGRREGGAPPPAHDEEDHGAHDEEGDHDQDHQDDADRSAGRPAGCGVARGDLGGGDGAARDAGGEAVRRPDGRARPVVDTKCGLDRDGLDLAELGIRQGEVGGDRQLVLPVAGGDGQQHVVSAETVVVGGLVRPLLAVSHPGERVDVDDEEVGARVGVELVEGGVHCGTACGDRADLVRDVARAEGDGVFGPGEGGSGKGGNGEGEQRRHRDRDQPP